MSKGVRIILIVSILSNLPIYYISLFGMTRVIRLRLANIQRDFFRMGNLLFVKWFVVYFLPVYFLPKKGWLGN